MYHNITKCLCCNCEKIEMVIDLGVQPLANSYRTDITPDQKYPLVLNVCTNCFHLQLSCSVDKDNLFRNYLYVSGTTKTLRKYFDEFADMVSAYNPNAISVLDIACNDGSQLDSFRNRGFQTYGIDPAKNIFEISREKGHNIVCDYFNSEKAKDYENKFDIITAQNVFAHNSDPLDFLIGCSLLMSEESLLFIQTSQANMILNNEFDTIYHEHISFFNTSSIKILTERAGLYLIDAFKTEIHGTSHVFVISKKKIVNSRVHKVVEFESENGLYDLRTYKLYSSNCRTLASNFHDYITKYKSEGFKCIGYGAAAKGTVFLNYSETMLDFIIDDNPLKCNMYLPGLDIPIVPLTSILELDPNKTILIPLAWNFFDEIKARVSGVFRGATYLRYYPRLAVEQDN